jgi:hypothetical protein
MTFRSILATGAFALLVSSCSPFPVPSNWPVKTKIDREKVELLDKTVASSQPSTALSKQERALLTFLAEGQHINEAIGKRNDFGKHQWRIAEIFLVEPGRRVSVLCEDGHLQEPLYFRYNPDNSVWYRVEDFENPKASSHPAVIVAK